MKFDFDLYQEGPNQCMVRRRSHDDYNGCGVFSVSEEFGAEICKRWNNHAILLETCRTALFTLSCLKAETSTCTCTTAHQGHGSGCLHHHVEATIKELHAAIAEAT